MTTIIGNRRPCGHGPRVGVPERLRAVGYETVVTCAVCPGRWRMHLAATTVTVGNLRAVFTAHPRRRRRTA